MARAKRRAYEEWAHLISEQRSSGETREAWCNAPGISLRAFRDWVYKLKREGTGGSADLKWLELKGGDALSGNRQSSSDFIDVFIGSGIIRVKPYFDRVLFADICKSLRELC